MHTDKEMALRQIDDIYRLIQNTLKPARSDAALITIGIGVMAIPALNYVLHVGISVLTKYIPVPNILVWVLYTLFYWVLFKSLGKIFRTSKKRNLLMKKVFEVGKWFPLIPLSIAASLAHSGYAQLIAPIVITLAGCLLIVYAQFSNTLVKLLSWSVIVAGNIGIYASQFNIPHLWIYLVIYQGAILVLMGLAIKYVPVPMYQE